MFYFSADWHLGHGNILKYCDRISLGMTEEEIAKLNIYKDKSKEGLSREELRDYDFKISNDTIRRHDDIIIDNINSVVKKDDVLWFLGDLCFAPKHTYVDVARSYMNRINCRTIFMVWGNHDHRSINKLFNNCYDLFEINCEGQNIVLCHYAMAIWNKSHRGTWCLYGHSHSNAEEKLDKLFPGRKSIDVGIDNAYKLLGGYRPFHFKEIQDIMSNRSGFSVDHHE